MQRRHLGHTGPLVRIDLDPAMLADAHRADLAIAGDAGAAMASLAAALEGHAPARGWTAAEVAEARRRFLGAVDAADPRIRPLFAALREVLPPETLIYSDMTQLAYAARSGWDMAHPAAWHHPNGFGTLGYALPAAIGGKIGAGARPVVAIAGDYGFQYTMQELGVAVELGLALPILLWDNSKLGAIEDSMIRAQIAPFAVTPRNPDFCRLAEAFGARAAAPDSRAGLQAALRAALAADGPTLIRITPATIA
jgi:acetolactate synthase-1/2/3 large subunit/5-guanidino-2-oxopentanoate decarboxylase